MRERKKKIKSLGQNNNKSASNEDDASPDTENSREDQLSDLSKATNKKRPRTDDDGDVAVSADSGGMKNAPIELTTKRVGRTLFVLIPSDLAAKDAKKSRKDARREIRQSKEINYNEKDYDDIEFVTREDMPSITQPSKKKQKKKREFPSIKELLKQKRQMEVIQKEESKVQKKMNAIPEALRAKYVALDCEMVGIGTDGKKSALARVSIVDWNLEVFLDTFVQVPIRVTDFRTHVSGVEAKHISKKNAMPLKECRTKVDKLLKGKILVGHALTNDFKALMTSHPKEMIRDTAKYRPFQRYGNGKWRARKLRDLVKENLKGKESFQEGEHDSVQDAMANMELFQVVFSQWEKELENKTR